ncbi:F-box/LRR-repeat protein 4-like isoform X2 [Temnothorax nylanderi]|uniref:F-box/LRR-repeat protein 4-like isoform X2 n=1 Tax=Temnothorax nylanderi TaxID=102681 RepID=UPI003A83BD33
MTFHYPFESESLSQCPYISRVSTGEENSVDFIYQFVKQCNYDCINNLATLDTKYYIYGAPTKFPKYGDFSETFIMRTYDFDISLSLFISSSWPEQLNKSIPWHEKDIKHINHMEIKFHEAVYPIRVSIYEVYNPGNIIKIWAQDSSNNQWILLWDGSPQIVPPISRLFSPPLQLCNFKTNILKLEFKHSIFDYTKLDAVMLIGTSELILPRNPEESLTDLLKRLNCMYSHHEDVHNLTANYEKAHLDIDHLQKNFPEHCIICKSDVENSFHKNNFGNEKTSVLLRKDEVILEILKHLDLKTLCLMNQVNKRFNDLTRDPLLYTRLNMRNICCPTYFYNILCYFTPRCKYLQQLDLTLSNFSSSHFVQFLENCGRHLTHLRIIEYVRNEWIIEWISVDNDVLLKISEICKNLKESLEKLELETTKIEAQCLCKILQKNKRMRELYLHCKLEGSYSKKGSPVDTVAIELGNSCRDLQIIKLYEAGAFTSKGINALADCKNLRTVYLREIMESGVNFDDSLSRLLSSCQLLEEIYLYGIVLTDCNLKLLAECKNLKRLDLDSVEFVTPDNVSIILEQCPKLQELCLLAHDISPYLTSQWEKSHPHVLRICY